MSKDRKDIYIGDGLKRAIAGRKESLSTAVNLIADRYQTIIERNRRESLPPYGEQIMLAVFAEMRGHRLEGREIAGLPALVEDYCKRNRRNDTFAQRLLSHLRMARFEQLVALVDEMERQQ